MHDELPQQYRSDGFFIVLVIVGVLAIGMTLFFRSATRPQVSQQIGKEFPPIEAAGWFNGNAPKASELRGHVLVVDAWAYWCKPCQMLNPALIELRDKYKDRGVIFIGLTSEGRNAEDIERSRKFVESEKILWLSGYGAVKTLSALEVDGIPQVWVVDRQNRIVFHEIGVGDDEPEQLEKSLIRALGPSVDNAGK